MRGTQAHEYDSIVSVLRNISLRREFVVSQELLNETQSASGARVIAYEKAEIRPGFVNDTWILIVSGQAPCLNMKVELTPHIYVSCPEYWAIEVVGTLPSGFCLTAIRPYYETIVLTGITGSKGIEVIGSNRREVIDVSGGCS